MKKTLPIALLVLISFMMPAQTGPAGVGTSTSNVFWLKADKGTSSATSNTPISYWNDQSGNALNVTQTVAVQQPTFVANVMNGFPAILFDNVSTANQNDKLVGIDSPLLDNTSGYSFFTVTQPQNLGGTNVIVSKRTTVSVDESFMLFYYTGNKLFVDIQTTDDRFNSNATFSNNINYIIDLIYDGTLASGVRCALYKEETFDKNSTETNTLVPDNASPILLGTTDLADPRPFGGYMSEIIIYRVALTSAQRIIVNNYLSAKYNIALSSNDKYVGDNPANGDYDLEVAGVGQESTGSSYTFSASVSGGLCITATAGLDNLDYLVAGHAVPVNSVITTDVTGLSGVNKARWLRIWFIDVTDILTPITANVEFDLSDGGVGGVPGLASDYKLLYRAAQTGSWTQAATASSISGDKILFTGITLSGDGYYTIGTINYVSSTLPIGLISFDAQVVNANQVSLKWVTAFEKNNAGFTLEKSRDGQNFEAFMTVKSAGNLSNRTSYQETDLHPYDGISYYRLKQTDINADFTYSPLAAVDMEAGNDLAISIYPNPSDGIIYINLYTITDQDIVVRLTDESGKSCLTKTFSAGKYGSILTLDTENKLAKGNYLVSVLAGLKTTSQKIILK